MLELVRYKGELRYTLIREGTQFYWRDNKERIRFDQSAYIPGNGAHHRLGKTRVNKNDRGD
jgi:hypothetical protein